MAEEKFYSERFKELRIMCGLTQKQVAKVLGTSVSNYSSLERSRTKPSPENLIKLSDFYQVSVDYLIRPDRQLKIGSWIPLVKKELFHPLENRDGFYILLYPLIFSRLFYFDIFEERFHMELIDSWAASRDESRYVLYIRNGVRFHNGEPLTLGDVKYSYQRALEQSEFYKRTIDGIKLRRSENAIEIRLKRWLELRHLPTPYILPRVYADDENVFIGTGPFRLSKDYIDGFKKELSLPVALDRNVRYYDEKPHIKNISLQKFESTDELKKALADGKLDFIDAVYKSNGFKVEYGGYLSYYLIFRQDKQDTKLCSNIDLRKAVDFSIDRERIKELVSDSLGIEDTEFLPDRHLYHLLRESLSQGNSKDRYNKNMAIEFWSKAKESLARDGIEDPEIKIAPISPDVEVFLKLADSIVSQLNELDIKTRRVEKEDADALISVTHFNKPEDLYLNLHSKMSIWGYKYPYMDTLLESDMDTTTYKEIQRVLSSEYIFVPLIRHGMVATHTDELDIRARFKTTSLIYGPDVAKWEFRGQSNPDSEALPIHL